MKVRSSQRERRWMSIFAYSQMGGGKTHLGKDFPNPVWIDFDNSDMTLDAQGVNVPVLTPSSVDEIRAIIESPEQSLEFLLKGTEFEGYKPETFVWDTLTSMQDIVFGEGPRKALNVFGGGVTLEKREAYGVMKEPNSRDNPIIPAPKDYRLFEVHLRGIVQRIRQMPYHSIVTAHAGLDLTPESPRSLSAAESERTYMGYPNVVGKMKYDIGRDFDFFLYLYSKGGKNFMCAQEYGRFNARTRLKHVMPAQVDWTNKNAYELLTGYYNQAKQRSASK